MSDVSTFHPSLAGSPILDDWNHCRLADAGQSAIKQQGKALLPMPTGFSGHDDGGKLAYSSYKGRAQFPAIMAPAVGSMLGIAHGTEIKIELPDNMEYLRSSANSKGLSLKDFHRRITRKLLIEGRIGINPDAAPGGGLPFLALYDGSSVINWDDDFFVLNESCYRRGGFNWSWVERFRVLEIVDGLYRQSVYEDGELTEVIEPKALGEKAIGHIPFSIVSAKDTGPKIESPPLVGVAEASIAIYQLSADYRHQLHMSGQETLVVINGDAPGYVGAGVVCSIHGQGDRRPDMKYVSPSCSGIQEHRVAIGENRTAAAMAGARMFEQSHAHESGEARSMRFRSETANLQSVLQMSCSALESALRQIALMMNQNPDDVSVSAPDNLLDLTITAEDCKKLWEIVQDRGLSMKTYFNIIRRGGMVDADQTFEEEMELISSMDAFEPPADPDQLDTQQF